MYMCKGELVSLNKTVTIFIYELLLLTNFQTPGTFFIISMYVYTYVRINLSFNVTILQ